MFADKTSEKLFALIEKCEFGSPKFNELNDLLQSHTKAQILAGNADVSRALVYDLIDLVMDGCYDEGGETKEYVDGYIEWFREWNLNDLADEVVQALEEAR